jgi:ADP-heptose:LPS heptosyltransferase
VKKEHILIIRFSAIGDVAMAVPVVYSLATQYPDIRITVLSRRFARPFFDDLAPNVDFMEADLKGEYRGVKGLNALYRRLTAKQFTKIADLHNVLRSEYLRMRFNMGRYRVEHINKHRRDRRKLTSYKNKVRAQLRTPFENYADVLARLGYPVKLEFTSLFPPEGGNLNLLPAIIGPKKNFEQWIGVAPTAAHLGKCYPTDRSRQVIEELLRRHPHARIFLFGRGRKEDELFTQWCREIPHCVYVSQHLENMQQELILMSHLDVMLSMDSSNMHMASLTATPVVSVWGATHPYGGFMGWKQPAENAIQADLDCRPCSIYGKRPCRRGDLACMNLIRPEIIIEKIEQIINPQTPKTSL